MQQDIGAKKKGGHRSILRSSTKFFRTRKSKRRSAKSVRWKDEQNKGITPDIYDIGKGCHEALAECGSTEAADYLERETERLAHLSQQRTPKPISKRIKHPDPEEEDEHEEEKESGVQGDRYASVGRANSDQPDHDPAQASRYTAENDPISSYRNATESPPQKNRSR